VSCGTAEVFYAMQCVLMYRDHSWMFKAHISKLTILFFSR